MSASHPDSRPATRFQTHREDLEVLEERLGYVFENREMLVRALTHRSFVNESEGIEHDNQRLEFLGDSVLGLVTAHELYTQDREAVEGALSSRQSQMVCESALAAIAEELELGSFLRLGRGETLTGGREKTGLLCDVYEAVIAAVYLDGGMDAARDVILRLHQSALADVHIALGSTSGAGDHKSVLQVEIQGRTGARPYYDIVEETGPAHDKVFVAEVRVGNRVLGTGQGRSKKQAEQEAAAQALAALEENDKKNA